MVCRQARLRGTVPGPRGRLGGSAPAKGVSIGLNQDGDALGPGTTPVFGVHDIHAARAELEAKGVSFEGDTTEIPGMVRLATFTDPDGNRYMLAQSLA